MLRVHLPAHPSDLKHVSAIALCGSHVERRELTSAPETASCVRCREIAWRKSTCQEGSYGIERYIRDLESY